MQYQNKTESYKTKDLAEAAMLIVKEREFVSLEKEGRIYWFVFTDKKACEQLSTMYYFAEVLVNARQFHETMSRLKGRIFAQN